MHSAAKGLVPVWFEVKLKNKICYLALPFYDAMGMTGQKTPDFPLTSCLRWLLYNTYMAGYLNYHVCLQPKTRLCCSNNQALKKCLLPHQIFYNDMECWYILFSQIGLAWISRLLTQCVNKVLLNSMKYFQ